MSSTPTVHRRPTGWLAGAAAAALVATLLCGPGASAAGAAPGRPAALGIDWRSVDATDHANGDGTYTAVLADHPVNYLTAAGAWAAIDNTVVADPKAPGTYVNRANSWRVRFAPSSTGVAITTGSGTITMAPVGGRSVAPRVSGSTVSYPDVWPGTDVVYTVTGGEVEESVLLKSAGAAAVHAFSVSTPALTGRAALRSAALVADADGSVAIAALGSATIAAPAVLGRDGNVVDRAGAYLATARQSVANRSTVSVGVSPAWLAAQPAAAYPIDVDPSITLSYTAARSYKSDGYTCTNCGVQFGNARDGGDTIWRSLAHYDYEQLYGNTVTAASFSVAYVTGTSNAYGIAVHHASAFSYAGSAAGAVLATGSISSKHLTGSALTSTLAGWVRNHTAGGYFGFVGNETKGLYTYQKDTTTLSITYTKDTAPGAPRSVAATAGNASAKVTFAAPATDGGSAITKYTVTSSPGAKTATGTGSPLTVTGLTNGTKYTFTVKATNSVGTGAASAASNAVTPVAPAGVPGAPLSVSATAGDGSAKVTFAAPTSNGGSAITKYTVTSSPGGTTATGTGSPITVTGLTDGTSYTFTVKATNSVGTGAASAASNAVTPTAPTGGGTPIPNLAIGWDDDASVTAADVSCMKGEGYSFSMLYTNIDATDWKTTYAALNSDGMHGILQQGFGDGTMYNDSSNGTSVGNDNVASAQSVNYPKGADFFLDVESTGSATESSLIDWINNWATVVAAAGYTPAVYSGVPSALQDSDLSASVLPKVKVYWQAESASAPDPAQGYVAVQQLGTVQVCGLGVDKDTAYIDKNGNHLVGS